MQTGTVLKKKDEALKEKRKRLVEGGVKTWEHLKEPDEMRGDTQTVAAAQRIELPPEKVLNDHTTAK